MSDDSAIILLVFLSVGLYIRSQTFPFVITDRDKTWTQKAAEASIFGMVILSIAVFSIGKLEEFWPSLGVFFIDGRYRYLLPSLILVIIMFAISKFMNRIFIPTDEKLYKAIQKYGDPLDVILASALIKSQLLKFSFKNSLVVIGWISKIPNFTHKERIVEIIPLFIGRVDQANSEGSFGTAYHALYAKKMEMTRTFNLKENENVMLLYLRELQSVSSFDIDDAQMLAELNQPKNKIYSPTETE